MSEAGAIYQQISGEYAFVNLLEQTAHDVGQNHIYCDLHDASPITLLDFDIVFGSLLSTTTRSLAARFGTKHDLLSYIPTVGPRELASLLSRIEHYTFPPGAEAELYSWRTDILGNLDARTKHLMEVIESAMQSSNPIQHLYNAKIASTDVNQLFVKEIADLRNLTSDAKALDLLRTKWVPNAALIGNVQEQESVEAYNVVKSTLDILRDKPFSNFKDALNAQYAVKVVNSEGRYNGVKVIPTLVSGTEPIATLNLSRWISILRNEAARPRIFASVFHFRFDQHLANSSDGSNRQIAALARAMERQTKRLKEEYEEVLFVIRNRCPNLDDDCIQGDRAIKPYMMSLNHAKSDFQKEYAPLLHSDSRLIIADNVSLINSLLSASIHSKLNSGNPITIKEALSEIRKRIAPASNAGERTFWANTDDKYVLIDNLPATAFERALFDITASHGCPVSLEETFPGTPIDSLVNHDWSAQPTLMLLVHPRLVSRQALLIIEARKLGGESSIKIRWPHATDCLTIINGCQKICEAIFPFPLEYAQVSIKSSENKAFEAATKIDEMSFCLDNATKVLPDVIYGEIALPDIKFIIWFDACGDADCQVNLWSKGLFRDNVLTSISEAISAQMSVSKIPATSIRALIDELQQKLLRLGF